MGSRSRPFTRDVRSLREAVMALWDPIGVAQFADAADEYGSYLPAIWRELQGGSEESLSAYLHGVTTDRMGLAPSRDGDRAAAARLFEWRPVRHA